MKKENAIENTYLAQYKAARKTGTPIVAISTPDQQATARSILEVTPQKTKDKTPIPIICWDFCRAWSGMNPAGTAAILQTLGTAEPAEVSAFVQNPVESLMRASELPQYTILICFNAHRLLQESGQQGLPVIQAIQNLRDQFKISFRTLILLGTSFSMPQELTQDVLLLDEPLPDKKSLEQIVIGVAESASRTLKTEDLNRSIDAVCGLSAFSAEQVVSLALVGSNDSIDINAVWERKRKMIEATPGLSVWRGGEKFDDIGGNDQVKKFLRMLIAGKKAPRVIVFIDEIEKAMAGSNGNDTSGVSQSFLGTLLTYMQDKESSGALFLGPPGAGKSMVAKAIGAEAGIPTIAFDLAGMKGSLVGESEERLRNALKIVSAVGSDEAMFVATCNRISSLPPELRRRFTLGTFFFDLPDSTERSVIWQNYLKKFDLPETLDEINSDGWTGAEIRQCCDLMYRLQIDAQTAAQFIVPVSQSAAKEIEELRRMADGKFLSASVPGVFRSTQKIPNLSFPEIGGKARAIMED